MSALSGTAQPRASTPAAERIYEAICDAVMEHRLAPGTRLPEASLSAIYGVSRPVVRKALARLAHENIVRLRPNRSPVVASPSVEETRDVFEARRVLETAIVRTAARTATRREVEVLRAATREERLAHERHDRPAAVRLSGHFHMALAELGRNRVMVECLRELISRTSLIIALYEAPGSSACLFHEHEDLIDAVGRRNEEAAAGLMHAHLQSVEGRLNLERETRLLDLAQVLTGVDW
ncbi:MAG: GntR family transcriptional regulator [Gammaproteobacteria bacterium]|nr:GntR family transcriptional regulator [Gammaproteobacteria bacterium]NIR88823.1 GntR family transcriptional regulator [Gammaproteobacteria bacterium]NIU06427.1 GntR family transcriptional regulator [Gammaproteobacteria bacterium]NIV53319.1 FCD domain-containing protein [Gammaproteobacteria bacterium]NIV74038.1 FCD domain-containing protein [Gammaproteobacteria bacterium]